MHATDAHQRNPSHACSRPKGGLIGIISLDDLILLLAEEMSELAKIIVREQDRETLIAR